MHRLDFPRPLHPVDKSRSAGARDLCADAQHFHGHSGHGDVGGLWRVAQNRRPRKRWTAAASCHQRQWKKIVCKPPLAHPRACHRSVRVNSARPARRVARLHRHKDLDGVEGADSSLHRAKA
eukprot:Amastigsp_a1296_12.p5 type:complete len:122 gc:universal Amastigsp_a1296_12:595-230(-)